MAKKSIAKKKRKSTPKRKLVQKKINKKNTKKISAKRKPVKRKLSKARKNIKVEPIPNGYHSLTTYLIVNNAANAIAFYKIAFGAKEVMRMEQSNGKISHAELKIGDSKIMLADEYPEMGIRSPLTLGNTPVMIHFYTKNVDGIINKAVSAGAKLLRPITDMFYGDRCGMLEDPYGHKWHIATHIEDMSIAKIKKRAAEFFNEKS